MERVTAFAPGSASNLGPGFDCLGIAFSGKGDTVTASRAAAPGVRVLSISDARIPLEADRNTAALAVIRRAGKEGGPGLDLTVEKGLPLAAGLGGSAASAVAGALAANAALSARLGPMDLLVAALEAEAAVAGERHADNVAPSLLGGAILVAGMEGEGPPEVTAIPVKQGLSLVLVTPGYPVETARARSVLPASVPRHVAVTQAARLGGLVLGLERGEGDLIRRNMNDAIAEPARAELYPGYPEARLAGLEAGALGVAVSGAGPSIVAIVPVPSASKVGAAMEAAYRRCGIEATSHTAQIDRQGARILA